MLLPFFQQYLERGYFPDGKGMLEQPVALVEAFELFVNMFRKYEKEDFKRYEKEIKNVSKT